MMHVNQRHGGHLLNFEEIIMNNHNKFVLNNHDIYVCIKAIHALGNKNNKEITRERLYNVMSNPSSGNALFILKAQIQDYAKTKKVTYVK